MKFIPTFSFYFWLASVLLTTTTVAQTGFDADASAYFTRVLASGDTLTEPAKINLNHLVVTAKQLGLWKQLVVVPCINGYGALHPLGGAPQRTNAKFLRVGNTALTNIGIKFTPGTGYVNHLETPFDYKLDDEPLFIGVLGNTETGNTLYSGYTWLRWGAGAPLLGTYGTGDYYGGSLLGFSTAGTYAGEFIASNPEIRTIRDRSYFAGAQFGGSAHGLNSVLNGLFIPATHGSGTSGRPGYGRVWFLQPAPETDTHVIQACVLFYGTINNAPLHRLWPLLATTLLDGIGPKYTFIHQGGQSNSQDDFRKALAANHWNTANAPLFHGINFSYGGKRLPFWVGPDPEHPARTPVYQDMLARLKTTEPPTEATRWRNVYFWMQGESDAETEISTFDYKKNLTSYMNFFRADNRPDMIIAFGIIDAATLHRHSAAWGNFTLSGCSGSAASANGAWSIVPRVGLALAYVDYEFTQGTWTLKKANGHWEFADNNSVRYTGQQDVAHPGMVTTWTASNGATGAPSIGLSRTQDLEIVRQNQRDYVASDPHAFAVDSRGCDRLGENPAVSDYVHINSAGFATLASRFYTAYTTFAP